MENMELIILITSDVHSHIFSVNDGKNEQEPQGMAKAASIIKKIRQSNSHTILIDNGDLIQGTPLANYAINISNLSHPAITINNLLQYDAAVIGNHEFNYGKEVLKKIAFQSEFPWISANVVKKGTETPYFGNPYIIREFKGLRVAVLGLTTKYIPYWESQKHIADFDFLDPLETAKKWITYLKTSEQADLIIVSYHGGFEKNPKTLALIGQDNGENQGYALATQLAGIDCLITGHQHLLFSTVLTNGIPVIQPGTGAAYLGKVTFKLVKENEKWLVQEKQLEQISVKEAEPDREIIEAVQPIIKQAEQWLDQEIGRIAGDMTITEPIRQVWMKEHPLVEWINKVQMKAADVGISCTSLLDAKIKGLSEVVSRNDIMNVYPFPNTLVVMKLSGNEIIQALEVSASFLLLNEDGEVSVNPDWNKPRLLTYNYDMWEGIEYEIDLTQPIGNRVRKIIYRGEPLDKLAYYQVAMNSYRASGSGGYDMFSPKKVVKEIHKEISELLIEDLIEKKIVQANVNQNWKVIIN